MASIPVDIKELTKQAAGGRASLKKQAPQQVAKLLLELEGMVMDDDLDLYARAYAWMKLLSFWAVLRGEDCTWLDHRSLRWDEDNGLFGMLSQSKTTGPDRKVKVRTIQVSPDAYFAHKGWIKEGLLLWSSAPKERQNFICLPSEDLSKFRELGAEPHDRAALTRWIYKLAVRRILGPGSNCEEWMIDGAARYWTEHSSRASLVSIARALLVPKSITDRLGWWSVGETASEEYIRTYRVLIAKVQAKAAAFVRRAQSTEMPDLVGENFVLGRLREVLEDRCPAGRVEGLQRSWNLLEEGLKYFKGKEEQVEKTGEASFAGRFGWPEGHDEISPELVERWRALDAMPPSDDEKAEASISPPKAGEWVVSIARTDCLHIVGACHRVPGKHYAKWRVVKDPVPADAFKHACRRCFPRGYQLTRPMEENELSEDVETGVPKLQEDELASDSQSSSSD